MEKHKQTESGTRIDYIILIAEASSTFAKKYESEVGSQRTYVTYPYWYMLYVSRPAPETDYASCHLGNETMPTNGKIREEGTINNYTMVVIVRELKTI